MADILIPPYPRLWNPAPGLRAGYPRPYWDYFNAPGRSGYNPCYDEPGDPVGHKGLDLAAPEFSPMVAADDGRVHHLITPTSNPQAGWGVETVRQVVGGWWGLRYLHSPEGTISVAVGDLVTVGQIIGQVGKSGNANYPHIHFEARWITDLQPYSLVCQGIPLDPLDFRILSIATPVIWPVYLRPGDIHRCVPMLRGLLYGLGYLPTAGGDQTYGKRVVAGVKRFQKDLRLEVDGIVGPQTRHGLALSTTDNLT